MSLFTCPLCGQPLTREGRSLRCPERHSFDLAKEGYVNLLPVQHKHSAAPGDDRGMAAARRAFLEGGYYAPLRRALCELAVTHCSEPEPRVLDSGCGEGYYTAGVYQALAGAGYRPRMAGIDISKVILKAAARRTPEVEFAVASAYHLPLADESVDLLIDCFSPLALEEFSRVLRPGGCFFYVVPAARHLWEMKAVLYDRPYPNEEKETPYPGFAYETIMSVDFRFTLSSQEEIHALFQMTPYYWKTPRAGAERLAALDTLELQAAFRIHVFRREG